MKLKYFSDRGIFRWVKEVSEEIGVRSYVVGGFVRDFILEVPSKDIDITVVGDAHLLAKTLSEHLNEVGDESTVTIFETYGTAQLKSIEFGEIEFVTARNESYNRDSRNPECHPGTLEEDIKRRDLTINAMAISLNSDSFGELVDMYNGYEDLQNKIARTPIDPDMTYSDDPLRMLRTIRFATKYKLKIDDTTYAGIKKNAERLKIIVPERIHEELEKILSFENAGDGIDMLCETRLFEIIFGVECKWQFGEVINEISKSYAKKYTKEDVMDMKWAAFIDHVQKFMGVPKSDKEYDEQLSKIVGKIKHPTTKDFPRQYNIIRAKNGVRTIMQYLIKAKRLNHKKEVVEFEKLCMQYLINNRCIYSQSGTKIWELGVAYEEVLSRGGIEIIAHSNDYIDLLGSAYVSELFFANRYIKPTLHKLSVTTKCDDKLEVGGIIASVLNLRPGPIYKFIMDDIDEAMCRGELVNDYEKIHNYIVNKYVAS